MTTLNPIPTSEPEPFTIKPGELRLSDEHDHIVHLVENDDLLVMLTHSKERGGVARIPVTAESTGYVVVSLGVDGDHDEIHFYDMGRAGGEEVLGQAIESLVRCREALARIRRA